MSRIIGLTGGIGSGKTEVARLFALLGGAIYSADEVSKRLLDSNEALRAAISKAFGEDLYQDSKLKRKDFASIIFSNEKLLAKANSIIHPFVFADFENWSALQPECSYLMMESAILFESHANKRMDKNITVYSPLELRISRVIKRDGCSREEVLRRMKFQISEEEKLKMTDFTIYNDDEHMLIPQVLSLHKQLI
jgi:dephospho-CoA kinase